MNSKALTAALLLSLAVVNSEATVTNVEMSPNPLRITLVGFTSARGAEGLRIEGFTTNDTQVSCQITPDQAREHAIDLVSLGALIAEDRVNVLCGGRLILEFKLTTR